MLDDRVPEALRARLAVLAPDQRAAATAPPGPILCVAPAGSGKTTTLVARIAWRAARGTDAGRICAVTFNKRAAEELSTRLGEALTEVGIDRTAVRVRTFHALGREILADAGVDVSALVDRATLLKELAGRPVVGAELRRLDDAFSRLILDPERGPGPQQSGIHTAFAAYRAALAARGALDFDDLVAGALARLRMDVVLLARWRDRCATLLVDEVQDLDRSQLDLALLLTGDARDIFLVGDDDQTIYAWRLADVRRILGLAGAIPGLQRVDLETNYRCPAPVVARSVRLIEHGVERFHKHIRAGPRASGALVLAADPADPLARARRLFEAWFGREEGGYAVLARTNAELAPFAALALERGIEYHAADDGLGLDHPTIERVIAAGAAAAPRSRAAWLAALLAAAEQGPRSDRAMARSVLSWAVAAGTPDRLAGAIAEARSRRARLRREDARLSLATIHSTKGLEFDHVAVIGLDHGTFPSQRSIDEAPDATRALEEERRLAYVAWTRAKRSLLLVYDPGAPSPFMLEAFDAAELAA
ncbi:MAG: ATP-dependent helicase [Candidatus Limnocylindrales bacterium]